MLTLRIKHPQYLATSNRTLHRAHLGISIPCGRFKKKIQESTLYKDTEGLLFLSTVSAVVPLPVPRVLNLHECRAGIISPSLGISLTDSSTGTLHQRRAHLTAALSPAKLVHPAVHFTCYQVTWLFVKNCWKPVQDEKAVLLTKNDKKRLKLRFQINDLIFNIPSLLFQNYHINCCCL